MSDSGQWQAAGSVVAAVIMSGGVSWASGRKTRRHVEISEKKISAKVEPISNGFANDMRGRLEDVKREMRGGFKELRRDVAVLGENQDYLRDEVNATNDMVAAHTRIGHSRRKIEKYRRHSTIRAHRRPLPQSEDDEEEGNL